MIIEVPGIRVVIGIGQEVAFHIVRQRIRPDRGQLVNVIMRSTHSRPILIKRTPIADFRQRPVLRINDSAVVRHAMMIQNSTSLSIQFKVNVLHSLNVGCHW